jgi:hypothetical protein
MLSRGKKTYKKSIDIHRLERDKRKKKREELPNLWSIQKSNRNMIKEGHLGRVCEKYESEMNQPELEIKIVAVTPLNKIRRRVDSDRLM